MDELILVNDKDEVLGYGDKLDIHKKGLLHRAFSIFIINPKGELLLQRRALDKYHSGGLWSNTCCSHPRKGEKINDSIHKRLKDEMGFDCDLKKLFSFKYKVDFENGLTENEFDQVFIGRYDREVIINLSEVIEYKWIKFDNLVKDIRKNPNNFSYWLKIIIKDYLEEFY